MLEAEQLLREYVRAGDSRDLPTLRRLLHPDVITHSPGGTTTRDAEGNIAAWEAAHAGLDSLAHEIQAVVAMGDVAAGRVLVSGIHSGSFLGVGPTGARIEVDQALFVKVAASRIVETWEIVDTGSGLRQLGVLDDQALSPGTESSSG